MTSISGEDERRAKLRVALCSGCCGTALRWPASGEILRCRCGLLSWSLASDDALELAGPLSSMPVERVTTWET